MQATGFMDVDLRLQRFAIEDTLVGAINPQARFLARSFELADADEATAGGASSQLAQSAHKPSDSNASKLGSSAKAKHASTPSGRSVGRPSRDGPADDSDDDDMQSACSDFASGQLDSQSSAAMAETGRAASVVPWATLVRHVIYTCNSICLHTDLQLLVYTCKDSLCNHVTCAMV